MSERLDELERLNALRERGTLSEAEYARAKANILGAVPLSQKGLPQWAWWALLACSLAIAIFVIKPLFRSNETVDPTMVAEAGQATPQAESAAATATEFEQLCMLGVFDKPQPLHHPVSALFDSARAAGSQVSWEQTRQGAIGRLRRIDPLTRTEQNLAIEFVRTADATIVSNCKDVRQGAVATRMSIDGNVSEGFAAAVILQSLLAAATEK
ncbi:MAG: SHOCT domain-containing protein [Alphaproteobacteria bacterium]|nr:MAG: SHOCT domain-containing protein [Alphaproteobacteria bacterium]